MVIFTKKEEKKHKNFKYFVYNLYEATGIKSSSLSEKLSAFCSPQFSTGMPPPPNLFITF
jgi:hypothetical protein